MQSALMSRSLTRSAVLERAAMPWFRSKGEQFVDPDDAPELTEILRARRRLSRQQARARRPA
jgi:hypothetical protein